MLNSTIAHMECLHTPSKTRKKIRSSQDTLMQHFKITTPCLYYTFNNILIILLHTVIKYQNDINLNILPFTIHKSHNDSVYFEVAYTRTVHHSLVLTEMA
jgi:hypothetical protein